MPAISPLDRALELPWWLPAEEELTELEAELLAEEEAEAADALEAAETECLEA